MTRTVQWFLVLDVVVFGLAALLHAGVLTTGYEHREARIAESVIALVLFVGLLITVAAPRLTRRAALWAQGFALLGTCVGVFTIARNVSARLEKYNGLTAEPVYHPPKLAGRLKAGPSGDYVLAVTRLERVKRLKDAAPENDQLGLALPMAASVMSFVEGH